MGPSFPCSHLRPPASTLGGSRCAGQMDRWAAILGDHQKGKTSDLCHLFSLPLSSLIPVPSSLLTHSRWTVLGRCVWFSLRMIPSFWFCGKTLALVRSLRLDPVENKPGMGDRKGLETRPSDTLFSHSGAPWGGTPLLCMSL